MSDREVSTAARLVPTVRQIKFSDLSFKEKGELRNAIRLDPLCSMTEAIQRLAEGTLTMWKMEGTKLILEVNANKHGDRRLHIWGLFGHGYIEQLPAVLEFLKDYAKSYNCTILTANSTRKGMDRILEGLGAVPVSRLYMMEVG